MTLAVYVDGRWQPGIGDPTVMGWLTVVAYLAAAALCAARAVKIKQPIRPGEPVQSWFWWLLAAAMTLLAINKQLDLQTWFTQVGKDIAVAGGWYQQRQTVQVAFVGAIAAAGVIGFLAAVVLLRRSWRSTGLALFGSAFLGVFIVLRAASFHHIDVLLKTHFAGVKLNWALELAAIATIAAAAWLNLRRSIRPAPGPDARVSR